MILYDLHCRKGHAFEAWFKDSACFDQQAADGEVRCPVCGSAKVEKALMAPRISGARRSPLEGPDREGSDREGPNNGSSKAVMMRKALTDLRRQVEDNCDYVGPRFAEEARRIHYGESDERNIYGESSDQEASALADEGIKFQRIPWLPRKHS